MDKRPVFIPYHKGGKRLHIGLQVTEKLLMIFQLLMLFSFLCQFALERKQQFVIICTLELYCPSFSYLNG